ncbi:unnamed protein product [Moneuplotes crassus]|uniref:Uncharacterized protein n=1 Tax=Euplotes crassus TaxID=5936 RepID=A0AAD1U6Z5_EUPCR|nr:unnamed protein product [Moneuplotes crassus]
MENRKYQKFEENLSEDILSEDACACEVKITERLCINMDMSPFKKSIANKSGRHQMSKFRTRTDNSKYQAQMASTNQKARIQRTCTLKMSQETLKELDSNTTERKEAPERKKSSIQSEISYLLKKSAQIRHKESILSKTKQKSQEISLKDIGIFSVDPKKPNFVTFGDEISNI